MKNLNERLKEVRTEKTYRNHSLQRIRGLAKARFLFGKAEIDFPAYKQLSYLQNTTMYQPTTCSG